MSSGKKEDFKITEDEVKKIGEALKDEKFRKLFLEYAEEIQNPENRKLYEQEIAQLENERGMNVQFIHPQPGHVLKTSVDGNIKAFINICHNEKIGKPVAKRDVSADGKKGINWSIPHSHTPPRDDLDKAGQKCRVFDVVFHPDTYRMAKSNMRFKSLVEDTALEGIERQFGVKVDRKNMKRPNLSYKGTPTATVIRTKADEPPKPMDEDDPIKNMPYPFDNRTSEEKAKEMADEVKKKKEEETKKANKIKRKNNNSTGETVDATVPKYTITHRTDMDLQEFRNSPDSRPSTRPKELVVSIQLPLLSSARSVELDIFEQKLVLQSKEPAVYKLDLKLPYAVDDSQGSAKFDKSKHCLVVTLPVVPEKTPALPTFIDEMKSEMDSDKHDENVESTDKPLIEVISTSDNLGRSTHDVRELNQSHNATNYVHQMPKFAYELPPFEFSQDSETITFIFSIKNIVPDSVSKLFPLPNVCHIKFISKGSGGFPIHYSFLAKFTAKNCFVPEHCSFDIAADNGVLLLLKDKDSRQTWDTFQAGTSLDELKDYQFETESSLLNDLEKLEAECVPDSVQSNSVEVTEMTRKKLSIKIQGKKEVDKSSETTHSGIPPRNVDADDELEDEECPSSADIEVVHEKAIPNLHGILKQRSISESSEDQSLSASSCSPESPREDFFKKSVKFNDRVDKTTFKTKAAVSSMTQALRSKRRRNRKREEKRNRKNSGSSEGSSDEHRLSDDHSDKGVESIEESTNEEVEDSEEKEEFMDAQESIDNVETVQSSEQVRETKAKQEKIVQDIKQKLALSKDAEKCDSDDETDITESELKSSDKRDVEDMTNKPETKVSDKRDYDDRTNKPETKVSDKCDVDDKTNKPAMKVSDKRDYDDRTNKNEVKDDNTITVTSDMINNPSDLTNIINENGDSVIKIKAADKASGEDSGVECGEGGGDKGEKSDVDTVLSWDDNPNSQEHRTECAFQFSNAMIYDLDVD